MHERVVLGMNARDVPHAAPPAVAHRASGQSSGDVIAPRLELRERAATADVLADNDQAATSRPARIARPVVEVRPQRLGIVMRQGPTQIANH